MVVPFPPPARPGRFGPIFQEFPTTPLRYEGCFSRPVFAPPFPLRAIAISPSPFWLTVCPPLAFAGTTQKFYLQTVLFSCALGFAFSRLAPFTRIPPLRFHSTYAVLFLELRFRASLPFYSVKGRRMFPSFTLPFFFFRTFIFSACWVFSSLLRVGADDNVPSSAQFPLPPFLTGRFPLMGGVSLGQPVTQSVLFRRGPLALHLFVFFILPCEPHDGFLWVTPV